MKETSLTPIAPIERIHAIDIIRGFSIFGIFLVNMLSFHSPMLYINPEKWWTDSVDIYTLGFIDLFAQANFYTLFSFLFGFGLVIFHQRVKQKGYSFAPLISRRLAVLLLFGCIHAFLIWHGDILISYAIIGAICLFFLRVRPITLLVTALLLIFVPSFLFFSFLLLAYMLEPEMMSIPHSQDLALQTTEVYHAGSFLEITIQRMNDWYYVNNLENGVFLVLTLLPMFLLGAFIAKKDWFSNNDHQKAVRRMWLISGMIAIVFKMVPYVADKNLATEYLQDSIGGPAVALFYASSIVLLVRNKKWRKVLTPFAHVGKLSLSNYLLQSLICTMIFYSYGLGYYGQITPFEGLIMTIVIYLLQVLLSKWWLNNYLYGPVEWLWRTLTYAKRQPMKNRRTSPSSQ
ncbi:DUF418 domain-containing protein [Litchfieldia alkalitelluris]|uniref:DUF418 domain-containing protein n=1 Tax=Litchfieldia alkalitelluris TaxID=304268 RepID=UPI001F4637B7|nr:DUF418 domain-containing protein [Litchfieldia alkalitelluris]